MDAETPATTAVSAACGVTGEDAAATASGGTSSGATGPAGAANPPPRRFHGTIQLDPERVGRDASRIADEVISHLAGQVGAEVTVTLEIEASLPNGASDQIVRTVTENSSTLKFKNHRFESE